MYQVADTNTSGYVSPTTTTLPYTPPGNYYPMFIPPVPFPGYGVCPGCGRCRTCGHAGAPQIVGPVWCNAAPAC